MALGASIECGLASPANGGLRTVTYQQNYGSTYRTLPPLPVCKVSGKTRPIWGCDKNESRYIHDTSHACQVPAVKLEGYMYGKPLCQDVSVLPDVNSNTGHSALKDSKFEVFPKHNHDRKTETDGKYVLGDSSRRALHNYLNSLYRTTTYSASYQDISQFMLDTAKRDAQFRQGCVPEQAPTRATENNHPYPCRLCLTGSCNKNFEGKCASFQSQSYDNNKINKCTCQCARCMKVSVLVNGICPVCDGCFNYMDDVIGSKQMDAQGKTMLPSSMHCPHKQNELATAIPQRDVMVSYHQNSPGYPESLCLPKLNVAAQENLKSADTLRMVPNDQQRNSWTNRDSNNRRVPCISSVLGSSYKSDAQKRFHLEHPEKVPDLRDFRRSCKRVTLHGFSTSLFR